jgi:hypothetical protein
MQGFEQDKNSTVSSQFNQTRSPAVLRPVEAADMADYAIAILQAGGKITRFESGNFKPHIEPYRTSPVTCYWTFPENTLALAPLLGHELSGKQIATLKDVQERDDFHYEQIKNGQGAVPDIEGIYGFDGRTLANAGIADKKGLAPYCDFFIATADCKVPDFYGEGSLTIIAPPGISVETGGHNSVVTMTNLPKQVGLHKDVAAIMEKKGFTFEQDQFSSGNKEWDDGQWSRFRNEQRKHHVGHALKQILTLGLAGN